MYFKILLLLCCIIAFNNALSEFIIGKRHETFVKLDFPEANSFCTEQNLTLATPSTEEIATSFSTFVKENSLIYVWTSLADLDENGIYEWFTTGKEATYTNWHKDEPDTSDGQKWCVQQDFRGFTQGWSATNCNVKIYVVCQVAPPELATKTDEYLNRFNTP